MFDNTYFEYCIDPTADEPIMLILKQIGNTVDEYGNIKEWGVQGADFCRELLLLDSVGKQRIQIWINSIGGSVVDGYSILGAMLKTKAKVDTYNIGVAASTAGWLFLAGRNRDMSDYATWMGHNPTSPDGEDSQILQKFRDSIVKITSERTGTGLDETGKMLDKETYMTASECLASGFCDTITATSRQNIKRMKSADSIQDKYKLALQISNIALPQKKQIMDTVVNTLDINITNKLGIDKDASVAMAVKGITELQNSLVIEQGKVNVAEEALKVSNKAKDDLQKKYDDACKDLADIKAAMEEEDKTNRLKEAKDMVNGFAVAGKIKNEVATIDKWVGRASGSKEDFEEIKNLLADLPVNKEANKIEVVNTLSGTGGAKNMAQLMNKIAEKHKIK